MKSKFIILWPLLLIFLVWFAFASPFFIKGKIPFSADYQVTFFPPWSQYGQFAMPVKNSAMPDVIDQLYPWKNLVIKDWKSGQIPLWNPYNFAGTPLLANYQSAVLSPLNVLFFLLPFPISWSLLILFQPLLAGYGMYFFARKIALSQIGAAFASLGFMFCSFIVTWMGYGTLSYAIAVLPIILLGLEGYVKTKNFWYMVLIAGGLGFSFVSGHFQISLYTFFAAFLYFLFRFLSTKNIETIGIGLSGLLSGVLLAAPQIFPSIAFYSQSLRSALFERPEVIPWQYLITLIAPDFFGNPVTGNDWFGHYAEWGSYVGLLPFLFAIFSLTKFGKNIYVRFFSILGLLALLLATPTFLGQFILYAHIPVLATSAAGRIIVLLSFSLAVLGGIGLDAWIESTKRKRFILGYIAGVILLGVWMLLLAKVELPVDKVAIAKQNFFLPTAFLLLAIGACILSAFSQNKRIVLGIAFIILLVTGFDTYRFASKWQSFNSKNLVFPEIGITKFFEKIQDNRALGNYGGQVSLYYQLPSVDGYDALYPERFGEFVSYVANGSFSPASRSVVDFPKNGRYTDKAVNLLGVRYIVHKISDTGKSWAFPVWEHPDVFKPVYKDNSYVIFENLAAFPRAFIAEDYLISSQDHSILANLFAPTTDQRKTLLLEKDPHIAKTTSLSATTKIDSYTPDKIILTTQSSAQALLFLSDTFFPGWHAYVDGQEVQIYRADYTFRAAVIPSGRHTVIFSYLPSSFVYGLIASGGGVILLCAAYFFQKRRVL